MVSSPLSQSFYYGQTCQPIKERFRVHKRRSKKSNSKFNTWLREFEASAIIEEICNLPTKQEADDCEIAIIAAARAAGIDCLNQVDGGQSYGTHRRPVIMIKLPSGEVLHFGSLAEASRHTGCSVSSITRVLRKERPRINEFWTTIRDESDVYRALEESSTVTKNSPVMITDIATGEQIVYRNCTSAMIAIGEPHQSRMLGVLSGKKWFKTVGGGKYYAEYVKARKP